MTDNRTGAVRRKPDSATVTGSPTLQAWLQNPHFSEAWDAFVDELDVAFNQIKAGQLADPEHTRLAMQHVLDTVEDHADELPIIDRR